MDAFRIKDNFPTVIGNTIQVTVYPAQEHSENNLCVLGLVREAGLIEIETGTESLSGFDAAITDNKELGLGITTKDCAPICIGDGRKIAIAHVGWQGFSLGLTEKVMQGFSPEDAVIYVGPFLHEFEIRKDFCYEALILKPGTEKFIREKDGKLMFYFKEALQSILPPQTIFDERNTYTDPILPSRRRDKNMKNFLTTLRFA